MTTISDAIELPSRAEETWKYTPVEEIGVALRTSGPAVPVSIRRTLVDDLAGALGCPRIVFVNGTWAGELSDHTMPPGITARPRANTVALFVEAGIDVATPIHVVNVSVPGPTRAITHPRTVVTAGVGSHVAVIETYCGRPGPSFTDALTTIRIEPAAHVDHVRVQADPAEGIHIGRTYVEQADTSAANLCSVTTGGDIARHDIAVRLVGDDARVDLDGLYLPTRHQRHDNVVRVDHAACNGRSTQRFRGVVDGHARGSFSGHVIVRADTVGNDARQTNRNLLLSAKAEADSRPWLEILADDVRCTHGATVGRINDEALFYLRSRGIPLAQSRNLLVSGFIAEIVDAISPPALRDWVAAALSRRPLEEPL